MGHTIKVHVDYEGRLVVIEDEQCRLIEAQDSIETTRCEVDWELEKVQSVVRVA